MAPTYEFLCRWNLFALCDRNPPNSKGTLFVVMIVFIIAIPKPYCAKKNNRSKYCGTAAACFCWLLLSLEVRLRQIFGLPGHVDDRLFSFYTGTE